MRSFDYLSNRDFWLSRIAPAGFGTPAYGLLTFLPITIIGAVNNGEPFPFDRVFMGVGVWFLTGLILSTALYWVFRVLDKKEYAKFKQQNI